MARSWTSYQVLDLHESASKDVRLQKALESLRPELEAARARGEWQPVEAMDRSTFSRFAIEHPDGKVSAPVALIWTRDELALLMDLDTPAARAARAYLLRGEIPLAEREGRVHPGFYGESPDDIARELNTKISLAFGIARAEAVIARSLGAAQHDRTLCGDESQAGGRAAEAALFEALKCTTSTWPYDRIAGWHKLYSVMWTLYSAYGIGARKTPFFHALERVDAEYAQLRLRNLEAQLKHRRLRTDLCVRMMTGKLISEATFA